MQIVNTKTKNGGERKEKVSVIQTGISDGIISLNESWCVVPRASKRPHWGPVTQRRLLEWIGK